MLTVVVGWELAYACAGDAPRPSVRLPVPLATARPGDWILYRVTRQIGEQPKIVEQLRLSVTRLSKDTAELRVLRGPAGRPGLTSETTVARGSNWMSVWRQRMREAGLLVKVDALTTTPDRRKHGRQMWACTRLSLRFSGQLARGPRRWPLEGRATYWLVDDLPFQGILAADTDLTLIRGTTRSRQRLSLSLLRRGQATPSPEATR